MARAGEPGSETFGLTMEEWSDLLGRLGQELRVSTGPLDSIADEEKEYDDA